MRLLVLLLPMFLSAWTFDIKQLYTYSPYQKEVLRQSYLVGDQYDIGLTLSAIAIIETRAGKFDFKKNHICGPHQINTNFTSTSCEALESNPFLSALEAKESFLYWYNYSKTFTKAIKHYNAGFKLVPHSKIYYNRFMLVFNTLRANKQTYLTIIGL